MKAIWKLYRNRSFIVKMTVGFSLGVIVGILFGPSAQVLEPLGDLLLRLLNLIVVPIILFTLIAAVYNVHPARLGRVGIKVFIYYVLSTMIAILFGIIIAMLIQPGVGIQMPSAEVDVPEAPSFVDTILNIVPDNIFEALISSDILGVIFIAVVTGFAISSMVYAREEKIQRLGKSLVTFTNAGSEVTFRILHGILQYAPIGIFAIGASAIGEQGLGTLISLGKLTGAVYIAIVLQVIFVYILLLRLYHIRVIPFLKNIREAIATAFMTQSSIGTLPITLKSAEEAGIQQDIASFSLPMGATVNMDGAAIRLGVSVIFAANIVGLELSFVAVLGVIMTGTLASIGTAGVPGAGLIALSIVLAQTGLPVEVIALVAGVDVILGMGATACNITGDLVGAAIIDKSEQRKAISVHV